MKGKVIRVERYFIHVERYYILRKEIKVMKKKKLIKHAKKCALETVEYVRTYYPTNAKAIQLFEHEALGYIGFVINLFPELEDELLIWEYDNVASPLQEIMNAHEHSSEYDILVSLDDL